MASWQEKAPHSPLLHSEAARGSRGDRLPWRLWVRTAVVAVLAVSCAVLLTACAPPPACSPPANDTVAENCQLGNPPSQWDIQGDGDPSIQGFATDISVDQGGRVDFKIKTDASDYRLDIYRMGYYYGNGARKVATVQPSAPLPQAQPACAEQSSTGLVDCGNWGVSAAWQVPAGAVSGIYFAKLVRESGPSGASHVMFVVRDDDGASDVLFQTSDTTWQAYNRYGGNSLYTGGPGQNPGRAYKVSYNRPFRTRATEPEDSPFNAEYPMVRWLESNGYDVSYTTGVDSDRRGPELLEHKAFLSVGHDEYWSRAQRDNVKAARDAGVHLGFFSGNEIFWKTRWEDNHRTLVSYKETHAGSKIDPQANVWTGTWRDSRAFNPEGPEPENALSGNIFMVNSGTTAIKVPADDGKMRLWRGTSVASQAANETATLAADTLGYEWDEDLDNGARPAGLFRNSTTTVAGVERLQDNGSTYAPGTATHHLTQYRDGDALVFGAGTIQWSWGLDGNHDRGGSTPDLRMQQATVNLLADMGIQPGWRQAGLTAATASSDHTAPQSTITSPTNGQLVEQGTATTISGTASDGGGGVVGGVEVSVDGGTTWHPATGRADWRYTWTPQDAGPATIRSRAVDDSGNLETPADGVPVVVGAASPAVCPCSIFENEQPGTAATDDSQAVELGVKFRSDEEGFITGLRFFKGPGNTGTHVGHLWSAGGQQLAEATFTGESASGWQEVTLDTPVAITANTTYVASYHAPAGRYAFDSQYFATGKHNPPLHGLAEGTDGPNGVYKYGGSGGFPTDTFNSGNYWVDVRFERVVAPDIRAPQVAAVSPPDGTDDVDPTTAVTARFDEPMNASTINGNTFQLRGPGGGLVGADVTYDTGTRTARLNPHSALSRSTAYTATVHGGLPPGAAVEDAHGNRMEADRTWSFTIADPPPPPPDEGPGGPVLVISSAGDPFGRYYAEILRAEGLNEFTVTDISNVTATMLNAHAVVVLAQTALTAAQASMLESWVQGGGNLIAMRPDARLSSVLGLTAAGGTLGNAYLKVDNASAPGAGITSQTIQFHGTADRYTLSGASEVARLYSDASTASLNPAVTLRDVGGTGGQAAAFTYDLARSVVYTRQGNPAWAGQERDGQDGPIRSDDLFFGAKSGDVQPDWVNLDKVAIPQADEQQRLLANLITRMSADRQPLPRFWYLPRGEKAAVVMTGDDHGSGGTDDQFEKFKEESPANCSVADWECIRSTSYVYTGTPLSDSQAAAYQSQGFEIALHPNTGCANFTPSSLDSDFDLQLAAFASTWPSLSAPRTNRTHCIPWSDWSTHAKIELDHGIRFDANYYYWPGAWIQDRPGMFTGSGMPMRFADLDGSLIDVYQAATQITDESGMDIPAHIAALLSNALGPQGYYGVFTANMHTDALSPGADAIVDDAQSRGVPVVSARQMLTWIDGRNGSSFEDLGWAGGHLTFTIAPAAGANGLEALVPVHSGEGDLSSITRAGSPVATETRTIKGIEYAAFAAAAGAYDATYEQAAASFVDDSVADFGAGTPGAETAVGASGAGTDGEVQLHPAVGEEFGGAALPGDWFATPWESGGGATVSDGSLHVNGARSGTTAAFAPGRTTEFSGTFAAAPFEHIGFGVDYNDVPWAMFSTGGGSLPVGLYARTAGPSSTNTPIPGIDPTVPHRYRIVWKPASVDFFVDGVSVATHGVGISSDMRPLASDFSASGPDAAVQWLRMSPYTASGTFLSRVFDAGQAADWLTLARTASLAGGGLTLATRSGNTAAPDASWSDWEPVGAGDAIASPNARYLQYRAVITTADDTATPTLERVAIAYQP
jgi:hypothetical protein